MRVCCLVKGGVSVRGCIILVVLQILSPSVGKAVVIWRSRDTFNELPFAFVLFRNRQGGGCHGSFGYLLVDHRANLFADCLIQEEGIGGWLDRNMDFGSL